VPPYSKHLLLVEDEAPLRELVAKQLATRGYEVQQAGTGEEAIARLADFAFDLLVTDLRLPGMSGGAVVDAAVARYPDIVAIVVTGYGTVKDAVEAIKRGAWDFVTKPFQLAELFHVLDTALEQRRLKSENAYLRAQLQERYRFEGLIGKSPVMNHLFQLLETVAAANSTILISGETGTGKEVVARAIHQSSPRAGHHFVALNCSAIPEALQEAEFFGHVRGAFTGAVGSRQGRLEQAHKGTLLLDEIGTMSRALQMKLLRVVQEREFERVGDSHTIKVDVRLIASTNSDLAQMVADGQFREDLYYRLNVIPVHLPPLRDRRDDIPLLVRHFVAKYEPGTNGANGQPHRAGPRKSGARSKQPMVVSQDAMRRLMSYSWPGNVRQLENAIERAMAFSAGKQQIDVSDLPEELIGPEPSALRATLSLPEDGMDLDAFVAGVERELIHRSLERTGGNKGQAAKLLHLKRTTLVEKLKRLDRA
jgi:DNA-binding NtrC family response regulator